MREPMIHLFLDTEPFRRDPQRRKGPFRALGALARRGRLRIHTSEMCLNEFKASRYEIIFQAVERLRSALQKTQRMQPTDEPLVDMLLERLPELEAGKRASLDRELGDWVHENRILVHNVHPTHAKEAVARYFSGEPPFKSARNREDLPDALIFLSLERMARNRKKVVAISNDAGFRRACREAKIEAHESIETFLLESGLLEELKTGHLESQLELVATLIVDGILGDRLGEVVGHELLQNKLLIFYPVETMARISTMSHLDAAFPDHRIGYFGAGLVKLPFSARAAVELAVEAPSQNLTATREIPGLTVADDLVTASLSRVIVFKADLLLNMEPKVVEQDTNPEQVRAELQSATLDIDNLMVLPSADDESNHYNRHAIDEAQRQIASGDLDTQLDSDEERDRLARARWVTPPEALQGEHKGITIGPESRLRIAPTPRFENWVRLFKEELLRSERGASEGADLASCD